MTIKEEIFDQIEELNTSLRELNDFDLVECMFYLLDANQLTELQDIITNQFSNEYYESIIK